MSVRSPPVPQRRTGRTAPWRRVEQRYDRHTLGGLCSADPMLIAVGQQDHVASARPMSLASFDVDPQSSRNDDVKHDQPLGAGPQQGGHV